MVRLGMNRLDWIRLGIYVGQDMAGLCWVSLGRVQLDELSWLSNLVSQASWLI